MANNKRIVQMKMSYTMHRVNILIQLIFIQLPQMDYLIFLLVFLLLSIKVQSKYRLYMQPQTVSSFYFSKNSINLKAILPENRDLIILYMVQNKNNFTAAIYSYSNGYLEEQSKYLVGGSHIGFIDAFWVSDQFLLVAWKYIIIIYRAPFYGSHSKDLMLDYNGTILLSTVVKSQGMEYFIVIEDGNASWIMKKFEIQTDNPTFLKLINQTQLRKTDLQEAFIRLIRTKNFICLLINDLQDQEYRIYGFNFDNNATANYSLNETYLIRQGDLITDSFLSFQSDDQSDDQSYTPFIKNYSISLDGTDIKQTIIYKADTEDELSY